MTFAVTSFAAYGINLDSEATTRCHQVFTMSITGTTTDLAYDVGSYTAGALGTFWTAVIADGTYGTIGAQALAAMQVIGPNADRQLEFTIPEVAQVLALVDTTASLGTHQYKYTNVLNIPSIILKANEGPSAANWTVMLKMKPGIRELRAGTP